MKKLLLLFFLLPYLSFSQVRAFKMDMSLIKDTSSYAFKRILIKSYEKFIKEDSTDYGTMYKLSSLYLEISDFNKSIEILSYLTSKQPKNPNPVGNRAFRYFYTNQFYLAKRDFDKAIELDETNPVSFLNRAYFETETEEYEKAVKDLKQAIKLRPDYAKAFANLGDTYNRMGNYSKAIENCNKAIELSPAYVEAILNRGTVYLKTKKYKVALKDFDLVLQLYPTMGIPDFFLNRGKAKFNSEDKNGAEEEFNKSIELAYHSKFHRNFAKYEVFNVKEDYESALEELSKAINKDENNTPELFELRADLYKILKNKNAYKADLKKAKEIRENSTN
jgi:tetratricopeptide (TPR) repeat protein